MSKDAPLVNGGIKQKKKKRGHWLFWWLVDQNAIREEVENYHSIKIFASSRGRAVICVGITVLITLAFVVFGSFQLSGLTDIVLLLLFSYFVYKGHVWAIVGIMIYWTFAKLSMIVSLGMAQQQTSANGGLLVSQVVWWAIYMHFFYSALLVEIKRKKI